MNVLAIYAVNQHIADLMAEAADARTARGSHDGQGHIRSFVASLASRARKGLTPPVPTLSGYPYRG